jgi:hypothetical protein
MELLAIAGLDLVAASLVDVTVVLNKQEILPLQMRATIDLVVRHPPINTYTKQKKKNIISIPPSMAGKQT